MAMPDTFARWTVDELHRLPDDGNRYELVRGDLFVTPPPSFGHQEVVAVLAAILQPYIVSHDLGRLHFPRSVMRVGSDSEVEPDLMVLPARVPRATSWADTPVPVLVIEVLSATTERRDRGEKRALYLDAAVPVYWIVDWESRDVTVVRAGHDDVRVSTSLVWHPTGAAEPLMIDLVSAFRTALD